MFSVYIKNIGILDYSRPYKSLHIDFMYLTVCRNDHTIYAVISRGLYVTSLEDTEKDSSWNAD